MPVRVTLRAISKCSLLISAPWVVLGQQQWQQQQHHQPGLEVAPHDERGSQAVLPYGVVEKTAVSSRLRLVLYVGLEGTGHNFFTKALKDMYATHSGISIPTVCSIGPNMYVPWTMAGSATRYADAREKIQQEMRNLAELERQETSVAGTLVTVQKTNPNQIQSCSGFGELSFPNSHGPNKALQYPDFGLLAEVAEAERVDLRLVYLQRSAKELIISNVSHRHFHAHLNGYSVEDADSDERRYLRYVHVLFTNIAVVHSMLDELGPGFVVCHRYNEMEDNEQATRIAAHVSPSATIAEYFRQSLLGTALPRHGTDEELPYDNAPVLTARLQRKLDVMEAPFCGIRG